MHDRIEADYDQLNAVASRFNNQSQCIQQMIQNVQSRLGNLQSGGWIGEGADSFYSEMDSLVLPAVNRLKEAMTEASRVTQLIAQTVQQAEEEACSCFRVT